MRLFPAVLLALHLAVPASAQTVPAGSGSLTTKESLKIGRGCGSLRGEDVISVSVFSDGSWVADASAGTFSGTASPADTKGRSWNLVFDAPSLELYQLYLEEVASALCDADVSLSSGLIESFVLKFDRDRTRTSLRLKTTAYGTTVFGSGRGKHQIKGKGFFSAAP